MACVVHKGGIVIIERYIRLDLQWHGPGAGVNGGFMINQGNVDTVALSFRIFDGANEIDYAVFDTARIILTYKGKTIVNSPCGIDAGGVFYMVGPEALTYTGQVLGQLDLFGDGMILATPYFSFFVLANLAGLPMKEAGYGY